MPKRLGYTGAILLFLNMYLDILVHIFTVAAAWRSKPRGQYGVPPY
jgi:hypothetical protein